MELSQKSGNKNMLSSAYSAMAVCYYFPYEKTGDIKDLKLVTAMCKKAVALYHQFPGQVSAHVEKIRFTIQELHPDFFKNINEKTKQKLTPLDLKYCAYIYLGMDTKQIANLLNVEPKSVRMTKYRLKKKFGLDENMALETFLQGVFSE